LHKINDIIGSWCTNDVSSLFLNIIDIVDDDDISYILLNLFGGVMAFIASYLINYIPFMVLESAWTVISLWGLYDYIIRKQMKKINLNDCKK
jgi:hypothetical protein